jgi:pimeloyl-ACP methyl ester carboxylesterase
MSAPTASAIEPTAKRFAVPLGEGLVAGWRFPNDSAQRVLFCHANGFCASAYKQMLKLLAPTLDVYAIDLRGHGRTSLPADPAKLRDWSVYARDISAVLDHASMGGGSPWILAGHSCGAVAATIAASGRNNDVRRLALIEPVAPPPSIPLIARTPLWPIVAGRSSLARNAKARRRAWPDRGAVRESSARKALFRGWREGVIDDYLEDGLIDGEADVTLACAPQWEAASFTAQAHDFWGALAQAPGPVSVLAADHPGTTLFAGAARRMRRLNVAVKMHQGAGHLLPMEVPAAAAAFILDCAEN